MYRACDKPTQQTHSTHNGTEPTLLGLGGMVPHFVAKSCYGGYSALQTLSCVWPLHFLIPSVFTTQHLTQKMQVATL